MYNQTMKNIFLNLFIYVHIIVYDIDAHATKVYKYYTFLLLIRYLQV